MTMVTLEEAGARLTELVETAERGEEIIITRDNIAVAKMSPIETERKPRVPGSAKGEATFWMADDFDAPMEEFAEYM